MQHKMKCLFLLVSSHGGVSVNFEEIDLQKLNAEWHAQAITDLDIQRKTGANVIGLKNVSGDYLVNPPAETKLKDVASLILLGDENQLDSFRKYILQYKTNTAP